MFELAIYSWKRCKRLVLNKENKGKEQICLSRTEYKIHEDVILELKQEGPEAMLSIASGQNLVSDGELVFEYALGEENVFSVFTGYGQELVILVNKRESVIAPLQKYYSWHNGLGYRGISSAAYISKFKKLQTDMDTMGRMINEHVTNLTNMAKDYTSTESSNASATDVLSGNVIS